MNLTQHFTKEELTRSATAASRGIKNSYSETELVNMVWTAIQMEKVRKILGNNPISVTSCFRNETVNKLVGGSSTSAHRYGLAVDFTCPKFGNTRQVCEALIAAQKRGEIEFDQLILEFPPAGWVHIGFKQYGVGQRKQVLTAKKVNGVTKYLGGLV